MKRQTHHPRRAYRALLAALPMLLAAALWSAAQPAVVGRAQAELGQRTYLPLAARAANVRALPTPAPAASATPGAVPPTGTTEPSATATTQPTPVEPTASPTAGAAPDCGAIPMFDSGLAPSATIHVAPSGSDATGDGSAANPLASIAFAARRAAPGTEIRVHEGTYPGGQYVEDLAGTDDAPIWIRRAPGEARPVLEGGGEGLHLTRVAWLVVDGLEVQGAQGNGINTDDGGDVDDPLDAHHVVFRNLEIRDIGGSGNQDCLKLSGLNDFVVADSRFARCGGSGSGSGIDMVGTHRGLIVRNGFEEMSGNAVQAKGGSLDIEVRGNTMRDAGARAVNMGGSTGLQFFRPPLSRDAPNAEARDVRVVANVIVGSDAPFAFVGCVGCLAAHNTVVDPTRWLMRILQETTSTEGYTFEPARDGRVVNNLFYFDRSRLSTTLNIGPNTAPETFSFRHNLWYAHDNPSRSRPDLPVPEVGGIVGQDPAFTRAYEIDRTSPAYGAGEPIAGVAADILGRCYGSRPSIGAYEAP